MLRFIIAETLDAVVNANNIVNLYVRSINERLLFSPQFVFISLTTSMSQIKV